jgi:hypothetical protein
MTAAAPITQPVKRKYGKRRRERYEQDWKAIAKAQANEVADFIKLLRDLSRLIPEELSFQQAKGRHRIPLSDVAFAMIFKVYFGFPGRVLGNRHEERSPLMQLYAGGVISRPMHWNSIGHHMRDVRMSEVLEYLIETSALALIPVEKGELTHRVLPLVEAAGGDFSADATIIDGAVRRKKGTKGYRGQEEYDICKLHIMTGNVSKVITACAIEDRGTMESPMFPGLLHTTAKLFPIANVYGDAAYAGVRSYALVDALKAKGWFRFSESHTGASGGVFGRVFKWANAHEDEFNEKLAKRNAVEATISSYKRVLAGGIRHKTASLRGKVQTAMKNEAYSMAVAHNIRVIIQFIYLVGLAPKFLPATKDQPVAAD